MCVIIGWLLGLVVMMMFFVSVSWIDRLIVVWLWMLILKVMLFVCVVGFVMRFGWFVCIYLIRVMNIGLVLLEKWVVRMWVVYWYLNDGVSVLVVVIEFCLMSMVNVLGLLLIDGMVVVSVCCRLFGLIM